MDILQIIEFFKKELKKLCEALYPGYQVDIVEFEGFPWPRLIDSDGAMICADDLIETLDSYKESERATRTEVYVIALAEEAIMRMLRDIDLDKCEEEESGELH